MNGYQRPPAPPRAALLPHGPPGVHRPSHFIPPPPRVRPPLPLQPPLPPPSATSLPHLPSPYSVAPGTGAGVGVALGGGFVPPPPPPPGEAVQLEPGSELGSQSQAVFSAAPKSYRAPPQRIASKPALKTTSTQKPALKTSVPRTESGGEKSSAQRLAERVTTATTVTRVAVDSPQSSAAAAAEESPACSAEVPETAVQTSSSSDSTSQKKPKRPRKFLRSAGGKIWEDKSLVEWAPDEFRVFAGDLGNDVTEDILRRYFAGYPSLTRVHVVRDKRTSKTRGYGFLSFKDSADYVRAMRDMNGKYVGSRPIKLKKSQWKDRQLTVVRRKERERNAMGTL